MKIVHLSDLHFGTSQHDLQEILMRDIGNISPDLTIISGDFTQVSSHREFKMAQEFLQTLPCPNFCVPGNHDMPRVNIFERFLTPFKRYKNYIAGDLNPYFENSEICLYGINTARPALPHWNWANGAFSDCQRNLLRKRVSEANGRFKIAVMHHPLQKGAGTPIDTVVFGGKNALEEILDLKIDLVLSGHVHHASITQVKDSVFLGASTALSSRLRRQENGYNVINLNGEGFDISHYVYRKTSFSIDYSQSFKR